MSYIYKGPYSNALKSVIALRWYTLLVSSFKYTLSQSAFCKNLLLKKKINYIWNALQYHDVLYLLQTTKVLRVLHLTHFFKFYNSQNLMNFPHSKCIQSLISLMWIPWNDDFFVDHSFNANKIFLSGFSG